MRVLVDADACPVKREIETVATRHGIPVVLVCNGGIRAPENPLVSVIYVDQGLDVADRWIVDQAEPGDVVVTADIPLAADCVAKGAIVLQPNGEKLTERNIGNVLATRDLMTDLRSANPLSQGGGGKSFSKADRSRFSSALEPLLR